MSEQEPAKKTPEQWGKELGHWRGPKNGHDGFWLPAFASASAIYGWSEHSYHYVSDPILLTEEQFESALECASKYPVTEPYGPAVSKCRRRK